MARARCLTPLVLVLVLALALVAAALARKLTVGSVTVTETPPDAGAPAALSLRTTFDQSTRGELSAVELDLARGFRFDPAAADTCSDSQARAGSCPPTSTVGRGQGRIVVQSTFLPRTPYAVSATFYLAKPRHSGDIAGLVLDLYESESRLHATILGRVVALGPGPYGVALRFSQTAAELPSGYDLSLLALTSVLQAQRSVDSLLTNPRSCPSHGWPVQLLIESGGHPQVYRSSAACLR